MLGEGIKQTVMGMILVETPDCAKSKDAQYLIAQATQDRKAK